MISHRSSLAKALWATLLFGSVPAAIRVVHVDSYALGIWRLSLAAVGMTAFMLWRGRRASAIVAAARRDWKVLTAVGVCFGLHWLTYFQSIKLASASIGVLGFSTCGVQLPLMGWLLGFGRPTALAMIGVALAMAGSALCLPSGETGDGQTVGLLLGILSGTLYAALPILHQKHARLDHELRTWAQFVFALPVFLLVAPAAHWSPLSVQDVCLLVYMGLVVNLIGHYLWVQVSTELPLTMTSALGYLQLPAALAFNYVLIGEELSFGMWGGATCIVAGNLLALRPGASKDRPGEALVAPAGVASENAPGEPPLPARSP